jgi:hypothetical protein
MLNFGLLSVYFRFVLQAQLKYTFPKPRNTDILKPNEDLGIAKLSFSKNLNFSSSNQAEPIS